MKLVSPKFGNRALSALMALMMTVAVIGCGGDNAAPEGGTKTAPPESETPSAPETPDVPETPAPKADEKPMKKEAAPAPTKPEPKPEPKKTETPAPAPKTSKTPAPAAGSTNLKPEVAVKAWFEGMAKGPSSTWSAFPASYQKDMNGLVQLFSLNMDAELWDRGVGTIKKFSTLLKSKKYILLDPSYLAGAKLDKEEAGAAFDHIVGLLEALTASDISSLDKMKRFDGGKFLTTTGSQFFTHIEPLVNMANAKNGKKSKLSDIANTKVTLVKSDGNTASLKIEVPNEEPKEKEFVKVEGKWIPADINPAKWKEKMDEARKELAKLAPEMKEKKASALQAFGMVDGFLGKLEKVETKEELQTEIFAIMGPAMTAFQNLQPGAKPAKPPVDTVEPPKAAAPTKAVPETKAVPPKAAEVKKPAATEKKE